MAKRKRQKKQWTKEKDRQYNGQKKKADNTMAKRKRQTIQWPKEKDRQYKPHCFYYFLSKLCIFL
jgi:hypothetical protein